MLTLVFIRDCSGYGLTGYGGYRSVTGNNILTIYYCNHSNLASFDQFNRLIQLDMLTGFKILTGYFKRANTAYNVSCKCTLTLTNETQ